MSQGFTTDNVNESKILLSDVTTDDATTLRHGFLKKLSGAATEFMNGVGNWVAVVVSDAALTITDITTNNVTTSAHGFAPKAVAPAAGIKNYYGIDNGETVITNKSASSNPGAAAAILATNASGLVTVYALNVVGTAAEPTVFQRNSADTTGVFNLYRKSRGGLGSEAIISSGDAIANLSFQGYDGSTYRNLAGIRAVSDGTPGSSNMPGRLEFRTTPDGSATITERMRITCAGNVKIAGTVDRATTEGTNHLDIFDGTAPVGTLANGVSLYSASGELRSMDSAGNSTLLSPHDKEGKWVFDSVGPNGKHLRIDMERMMKAINARFGWDFVHEFAEV